jgi:hypothetical protein
MRSCGTGKSRVARFEMKRLLLFDFYKGGGFGICQMLGM